MLMQCQSVPVGCPLSIEVGDVVNVRFQKRNKYTKSYSLKSEDGRKLGILTYYTDESIHDNFRTYGDVTPKKRKEG